MWYKIWGLDKGMVLVICFCLCLSTCSSNICWKDYSSFIGVLLYLCQNQLVIPLFDYFRALSSIPLVNISVPPPVLWYFDYCSYIAFVCPKGGKNVFLVIDKTLRYYNGCVCKGPQYVTGIQYIYGIKISWMENS